MYRDPEVAREKARQSIERRKALDPVGFRRRAAERSKKSREKRKAENAELQARRRMMHSAAHRAKRDGYPFDLQLDDIIVPAVCPVFGTAFTYGERASTPSSPSLDKLVPSLGYVPGNVQVISLRANRMKQDMTLEELDRITTYVRSHMEKTQ